MLEKYTTKFREWKSDFNERAKYVNSTTLEISSDLLSFPLIDIVFRTSILRAPLIGLSAVKSIYDLKRIKEGKNPTITTISKKFQNVDLARYNLINVVRSLKRRGKKS